MDKINFNGPKIYRHEIWMCAKLLYELINLCTKYIWQFQKSKNYLCSLYIENEDDFNIISFLYHKMSQIIFFIHISNFDIKKSNSNC